MFNKKLATALIGTAITSFSSTISYIIGKKRGAKKAIDNYEIPVAGTMLVDPKDKGISVAFDSKSIDTTMEDVCKSKYVVFKVAIVEESNNKSPEGDA